MIRYENSRQLRVQCPTIRFSRNPVRFPSFACYSHGTMAESSDGKKLNGPQNRKYFLSGHAWRMFAGPGSRRPSSEVREPGSQRLPLSTPETTWPARGPQAGLAGAPPAGGPSAPRAPQPCAPPGPGQLRSQQEVEGQGLLASVSEVVYLIVKSIEWNL